MELNIGNSIFEGLNDKNSLMIRDIVSLPHPSSSHGLSDDYISLYTGEIGGLIADFKKRKKKSSDE